MLQFSLAALHYPLPNQSLQTAMKVDTDFEFGHSCRDAVWTLAYALNKTIEGSLYRALHRALKLMSFLIVLMTGQGQRFIMNTTALEIIKKNLDATHFDGLSVKPLINKHPFFTIKFDSGLS